MSARAPLRGLPERLLEGGRLVGTALAWVVAGLAPLSLAGALAALMKPWVPSPALRVVLGMGAMAVTFLVLLRLGLVLVSRLHVARTFRLGDDGALEVGAGRRYGDPRCQEGDPGELAVRVEPGQLVGLFRVPLEWAGLGLVAVGAWYRGPQGRTCELWMPMQADLAERVLGTLAAAADLEVRAPEGVPGGPGDQDATSPQSMP